MPGAQRSISVRRPLPWPPRVSCHTRRSARPGREHVVMLAAPTEDAMKIHTLALLVAAVVGCHHNKPATSPAAATKTDTPAASAQKPAPVVTTDQQVSP